MKQVANLVSSLAVNLSPLPGISGGIGCWKTINKSDPYEDGINLITVFWSVMLL